MIDSSLLPLLLLTSLASSALAWVMRRRQAIYAVSLAGSMANLAISLTLIARVLSNMVVKAFGNWLYLDNLGALILLVVAVVTTLACVYSIGYMEKEYRHNVVGLPELRRYFGLFHLFTFTMLLACSAGNLGLLWTAVSATTLASAPLVDFYGSQAPLEAAWKYVVLTVAGSLIALFGLLLLYQSGSAALGGSYDFSIPVLAARQSLLAPTAAILAFLLVLIGFGTKAGLAPMHTWLPDAHSQAPSPVCAMLSAAELNCAMLAILRVYSLTNHVTGAGVMRFGLLGLGLLSMAVGVVFLVSQRDFKRLLAYSSIEQMGLVAVGVGVGAPLAIFGAMFQLVNHAVSKAVMFFATGDFVIRFRTTAITDVRGAMRTMPLTAILLLVGAIALGGAPPFGLFISEFSIVNGALASRQWIVGGAIGLLLVIAFVALVTPLSQMVFGSPSGPPNEGRATVEAWSSIPVVTLLAVALILGVYLPGPLHNLIGGAAKVVGR